MRKVRILRDRGEGNDIYRYKIELDSQNMITITEDEANQWLCLSQKMIQPLCKILQSMKRIEQ